MRRDEWARLAAPFPPQALAWRVAALDLEGSTGRLEPVVSESAASRRLDDVLGIEGWSMRLTPLGPDAVVCELELLGVHKSAVARSFDGRIDMQRVCGWAFGCAAALFGLLPPRSEGAWVDFDLDGGEPVLLPGDGVDDAGPLTHDDGAPADGVPADGAPGDDPPGAFEDGAPVLLETPAGAGVAEASAGEAAPPEAAGEVRSPGQQAIERLVDRLRAEGLGRQAAGLVVAHGGYGRSPEDARSLYRELRELLLEKGAVS